MTVGVAVMPRERNRALVSKVECESPQWYSTTTSLPGPNSADSCSIACNADGQFTQESSVNISATTTRGTSVWIFVVGGSDDVGGEVVWLGVVVTEVVGRVVEVDVNVGWVGAGVVIVVVVE
jgi:hypothetical protein